MPKLKNQKVVTPKTRPRAESSAPNSSAIWPRAVANA
jgi:hypothetical protein